MRAQERRTQAAQTTADLAIEVTDPQGQAWTLDWTRPPRPETLLLVEPGRYRLTTRPAEGQAPRALAPLRVSHRPVAEDDAARVTIAAHVGGGRLPIGTGRAADSAAARDGLEAGLERLAVYPDPALAAQIRVRLGEAWLAAGDPARAESLHREALAVFESLGDRAGAVDASATRSASSRAGRETRRRRPRGTSALFPTLGPSATR